LVILAGLFSGNRFQSGAIAMMSRIRTAVAKSTRPIYLAALSATVFFAVGMQNITLEPDIFARHAVYTLVFFAGTWIACRLFSAGLDRRLRLEGASPESASDMIYTFVIYLEVIKHVVGISFTLGWIAGVMAAWEFLGDRVIFVPVGVSMAVSLLAFAITYGFSSFTDQVRWPIKDEDN
jgi:hypothetical protein